MEKVLDYIERFSGEEAGFVACGKGFTSRGGKHHLKQKQGDGDQTSTAHDGKKTIGGTTS